MQTQPTQGGVTGVPERLRRQVTLSGQLLLANLRDALVEAEHEVAMQRRAPCDAHLLALARRHHYSALDAYEQALTALKLPVPPRLRDELRLLRRLVSH